MAARKKVLLKVIILGDSGYVKFGILFKFFRLLQFHLLQLLTHYFSFQCWEDFSDEPIREQQVQQPI